MRSRASAWIVVAAALLAGCAIGPDYKRPSVAEPQTFRGQATIEAVSLADAAWWQVFEDPILKNLVDEALRNNYDVAIAAARVLEARANLLVARSDLFPSFDYGGSVSRGKVTPGILGSVGGPSPSASNFYSADLQASWELDIWGRIRRSNEAARAVLFATEDARRGVWLTLVSDVAQAYFELLALDVLLQIAKDSRDAYLSTYNLFQDRLKLGVASKLETARAEGALGGAEATIPELESQIAAKENQISILLGKAPTAIARGTPMYQQPVVPAVPAGLPSTLLERRPDLRQAEQQLVAANARIGIAKADFFPRVNLAALIGTAAPEVSALTGNSATIWAVAGIFTGPLFNAGRTLGTYRASIAQWDQVRLAYQQAVLTALREVSDALIALAKLSDAETGQDRAVKALEAAVQYATDRYRQGLANYFEVLEALQQLYPAQTTLAQIRRDRLVTHVQLYRALGGGWNLRDDQWRSGTASGP